MTRTRTRTETTDTGGVEPLTPRTMPMPLRRWMASPDLCARFREIVENDEFRMGVATLRDNASPSARSLRDPVADARQHAWLAGYHDALHDIFRLARATVSPNPELDSEWEHIGPQRPIG